MAFKRFQLEDDLGEVTIYKRRGARSMRLSIAADGTLRVTVPAWVAYNVGLQFVQNRRAWIAQHRAGQQRTILVTGQLIGKAHRLRFVAAPSATKVTTRVAQTEIIITHPHQVAAAHTSVQQAASGASVRALRTQAERLLPQRLQELASRHGFTYRSVSVRRLKSRWGSCDQNRDIVLNLYLMQLPWRLIDYVLVHELTHTRILRHGTDFWQAMQTVLPDVQQCRRDIRAYQPMLQAQDNGLDMA